MNTDEDDKKKKSSKFNNKARRISKQYEALKHYELSKKQHAAILLRDEMLARGGIQENVFRETLEFSKTYSIEELIVGAETLPDHRYVRINLQILLWNARNISAVVSTRYTGLGLADLVNRFYNGATGRNVVIYLTDQRAEVSPSVIMNADMTLEDYGIEGSRDFMNPTCINVLYDYSPIVSDCPLLNSDTAVTMRKEKEPPIESKKTRTRLPPLKDIVVETPKLLKQSSSENSDELMVAYSLL